MNIPNIAGDSSPRLGRARLAAGAVLLVTAAAQQVRADAYAYSFQFITDMKFANAEVFDHQGSSATNTAEYSNYPTSVLTGPVDPLQAKSGPGPFPGENYFIHPWGDSGQYSRADVQITSISLLGMSGQNAAEAYVSSVVLASSEAESSVSLAMRPVDGASPIVISLHALPYMEASTTLPGEQSRVSLSFVVTLVDHESKQEVLSWRPNGDPFTDYFSLSGTVSHVVDPFDLQATRSCIDSPGCHRLYEQDDVFSLSYKGGTGQTFDVTVAWSERASVQGVVSSAPEPSPWTMWLAALPGVLWWGRRRSAARRAPI